MELKRIGDRLQATLDPVEILKMTVYGQAKLADAVRSAVWRTIQVHPLALDYLNGMKIGWSAVDVVNNKFVITFGPASFRPDQIVIPEPK
jgi:hypothetical protein